MFLGFCFTFQVCLSPWLHSGSTFLDDSFLCKLSCLLAMHSLGWFSHALLITQISDALPNYFGCSLHWVCCHILAGLHLVHLGLLLIPTRSYYIPSCRLAACHSSLRLSSISATLTLQAVSNTLNIAQYSPPQLQEKTMLELLYLGISLYDMNT